MRAAGSNYAASVGCGHPRPSRRAHDAGSQRIGWMPARSSKVAEPAPVAPDDTARHTARDGCP
ncbi:hypothetical protein ABB29_08830 [Pseudoxanthomonas dokdonensis]|uniref:Uncharacterized protein n=1 Tax=Pseudoxanthomonas dokdonensis TaxID=344882 RepID=A0A0R0CV98_9GAMM|nr:hypothetical protein ABB29_08830 [Pseudoxanthomonas dokdonensis]